MERLARIACNREGRDDNQKKITNVSPLPIAVRGDTSFS